ncbi:hypothetical protein [Gemella sp. zg-1178]|uniref:hypothetical protein n=1 Tax=Gemella sp. zg-1178 TaxID=2840372 RepID=UPI001C03BF3F|nr:hypothetical protein [Gemella sp. zg-1178]MBU0278614.1 hypothetical protein [Gemella sp. zg-1178]
MKVSMVKEILEITSEELEYFYNIINNSLNFSLGRSLVFLKDTRKLQSLSIYSLYPLMFREKFNLSNKQLEELIVFSHNHFTSLFLLDKIYDSQKIDEPLELLLLLEQYSINMKYLSNFPEDVYIIENVAKTLASLFNEKYSYEYNKILNLQEEEKYVHSKYSFAKIALYLYHKISKEYMSEEIINELYESHDKFAYGRQILDDLEDFIDDYKAKQFNIYVNRYYIEYGEETIPKYDKKLFLNLILEAKKYFIEAKEILSQECIYWQKYIHFYIKNCDRYILDK